jgi:hypothetical protein
MAQPRVRCKAFAVRRSGVVFHVFRAGRSKLGFEERLSLGLIARRHSDVSPGRVLGSMSSNAIERRTANVKRKFEVASGGDRLKLGYPPNYGDFASSLHDS